MEESDRGIHKKGRIKQTGHTQKSRQSSASTIYSMTLSVYKLQCAVRQDADLKLLVFCSACIAYLQRPSYAQSTICEMPCWKAMLTLDAAAILSYRQADIPSLVCQARCLQQHVEPLELCTTCQAEVSLHPKPMLQGVKQTQPYSLHVGADGRFPELCTRASPNKREQRNARRKKTQWTDLGLLTGG